MAELNHMMDQLKNAHIMTQEESRQQQQAQQRGRQQMGAVQDMVQRETGLLDHAQLRAPHPQFRLPPMILQDSGRLDLFPSPGTEDSSQPPEMPPGLGQQTPPDQPGQSAEAPAPQTPASQTQAADARTQRALHRALDALKQGVGQSGHTPPAKLDEAGRAMEEAAGALARNDDPAARDAVGRAIAALQQGGQAMAKDQQGQGGSSGLQLSLQPGGQSGRSEAEGEEGSGDGHLGGRRDPFGRQVDGNGQAADDPDLRVPDEMERGRSRRSRRSCGGAARIGGGPRGSWIISTGCFGRFGRQAGKAFFFAKKKQKTFISPHLHQPALVECAEAAQSRGSKSFLVLFCKKRTASFLPSAKLFHTALTFSSYCLRNRLL